MSHPVVLSLGGSIVVPPGGVDISFLQSFRNTIMRFVHGGSSFIIVVGGGNTARAYQQALRDVGVDLSEDLDKVGIAATMVNAECVRALFGAYADQSILSDPQKKMRSHAPIVVAGGWKPGASTDTVAIMLAKKYGATSVINMSNTDGVYSGNPKENPQATLIEHMHWDEYRTNILGETVWSPGLSLPFDPMASQIAEREHLTVKFIRGTNMEALSGAIGGTVFFGTTIDSPS